VFARRASARGRRGRGGDRRWRRSSRPRSHGPPRARPTVRRRRRGRGGWRESGRLPSSRATRCGW